MTDSVLHIPGYTVNSRLGKGGMADVYLATQVSLQREVAIKVLHNANDEAFSSRFTREAHILASLNHPAIITIYDIDRLPDGRLYLAMEYVAGGDLAQFKGQVLEPARALSIIRQLASGLAAVHDKGIIHRDVKPGNILFREDGCPVITDFGVAKEVYLDSELTHSGIAVGSPSYSSPEQAQCQPLDARTDIYSLGVVLLEMLLGSNPFRGVTYTESVMKHVQMDVPALPVPLARWQPVLDGMLAKQPQARFANCHQLLETLDTLAEYDEDTYLGPAHVPFTPPRRSRAWLGVILLLLLVGSAGGGGFHVYQHMQTVELLVRGEQRLQEGALLAPPYDNADYYFREALKRDPDNARAFNGLENLLKARVASYLQRAEERFATDDLLLPENDGAVHYFRQVLGWVPGHPQALDGLQRVAGRYVDMAQRAYQRSSFSEALSYIERGLEVVPEHAQLVALRAQHEARVAAAQVRKVQPVARQIPPNKPPVETRPESSNPVKRLWSRIFN